MALIPNTITPRKINRMQTKLACLNANYVSILAMQTKLSRSTVTKFFNGEKIRRENEEKIYDAGLEFLKLGEAKEREREQLSTTLLGVC